MLSKVAGLYDSGLTLNSSSKVCRFHEYDGTAGQVWKVSATRTGRGWALGSL
jgi:hypothetical protein